MSDAAGFGEMMLRAKLVREIDEGECRRRNALSEKGKGLALRQGSVVTVLETLDEGKAFLVEFGQRRPTHATGSESSTHPRSRSCAHRSKDGCCGTRRDVRNAMTTPDRSAGGKTRIDWRRRTRMLEIKNLHARIKDKEPRS